MNKLSDYKYPEFNEDFEGMIPVNSGGGSVEPLTVFITEDGIGIQHGLYMNKTGSEIYSAFITGTPILFIKPAGHGEPKYYFCVGMNVVEGENEDEITYISLLMTSLQDNMESNIPYNVFTGDANTRPFSKMDGLM